MKPRAAFDFETSQWVKPICVAFAWPDGEVTYHKGEDSARFAIATMAAHPEYDFWAHNMGRFDGLILAEAAHAMGIPFDAAMSGGSIVSLSFFPRAAKWKVYDSYRVVQSSLKKAAESFALPSRKLFTEDDYSCDPSTWDAQRLKDGCITDARIVLELLDVVETIAQQWGGELKATFSATALSCIKASLSERGLAIPRHLQDFELAMHDFAREACIGSRVEVFRHFPVEPLSEWDISSSYPFAMTQPMPWEPIGQCGRKGIEALLNGQYEGIIDVTIDVPESQYPPLPFPCEGVYFPFGTWRGIYTAAEVRYALQCGARIIRAHSGTLYTIALPFNDFVHRAYAVKAKATGALREFAKLVMNGAYGKFGQRADHEKLVLFPNEVEKERYIAKYDNGDNLRELSHRALSVKTVRIPSHAHYAIAAYVLAYARINLHKGIMLSSGLAYVDTDSLHCIEYKGFVGLRLGDFALKHSGFRGEYYAPKLYRLTQSNGEQIVHAKGFPVDPSVFDKIIAGESINRERNRLLRSQLNAHNRFGDPHKFIRVKQSRSWKGISRKRRILQKGETGPWNVTDIIAGKHLKQTLTRPN